MSKILITSGCSFSETKLQTGSWPAHLYEKLKNHNFTEFKNYAMGSQGNGLISRSIIYGVLHALKTYQPQDILVGVMWSASGRMDYRIKDYDLLSFTDNIDGWVENPTGFVEGAKKHWMILNQSWKCKEARLYYEYFYDYIGAAIYSFEHILRTQQLLKLKNINYFFTNFINENILYDKDLTHPEIEYLYKEIDQTNYLPVDSEQNWLCKTNAPRHCDDQLIHPSKEEHKLFVDSVIYPYLTGKNII